jgi:hypothetical protein
LEIEVGCKGEELVAALGVDAVFSDRPQAV